MKTLNAIGLRHGTDQSSSHHDYLNRLEFFFERFRYNAPVVVEIGIGSGASLSTWQEYFGNGLIVGIDHNPEFCKGQERNGIKVICGEAASPLTWKDALPFVSPIRPAIVIDDGGHHAEQIIPAFVHAWPIILPGGLYVCEDLHTAYMPEYNQATGYPNAVQYFADKLAMGLNESGAGQVGTPKLPGTDIDFIHFSKSLVVIGKRP